MQRTFVPARALNNLPRRRILLPEDISRTWLGADLWANRLQDWRLNHGQIECLNGRKSFEVRTVALLTRSIAAGKTAGSIRMKTGLLGEEREGGFCGFMFGVGSGLLDYRAAALAQRGSGIGGGSMAVMDANGRLSFRDHSDESKPLAYAELAAAESAKTSPPADIDENTLELSIIPTRNDRFDLTLRRYASRDNSVNAECLLADVEEHRLIGGLLLVSSPPVEQDGARWWFRDIETRGNKIGYHPERLLGPVLGGMYSLNRRVLKLSVQLMPIGRSEPREVMLSARHLGRSDAWRSMGTARIEPGFVAIFRVADWDVSKDWEYRVTYRDGAGGEHEWLGQIRADPVAKTDFAIGLFSCLMACVRPLEADVGKPELPQARLLGRYTRDNIYFPHTELLGNAASHDPDLAVFCGDQFYEHFPTRAVGGADIELDMLYRWYLWYWAHREFLSVRPAIVIVDDHDVFHGNIWGEGGRLSETGDHNRGGYLYSVDFVNMVQRTQCGHNPDPHSSGPLESGMSTYYGAFRYGGVRFAMLEDRKFKTAPIQGQDLDVHEAELLGARQLAFLQSWAGLDTKEPKIVLTQTLWACPQTSVDGKPLLDFDSNGYPPLARVQALSSIRSTGALMLSGDQHLAMVVRHGIDAPGDGPVQFSGPAAGTRWQRWFEPLHELANAGGGPNTGDFRDAFGNHVRVLATANPKISFAEYRRHVHGRRQSVMDRNLKSEGYGIIHIDRSKQQYRLECWPWDAAPELGATAQFKGWPITLDFDDT